MSEPQTATLAGEGVSDKIGKPQLSGESGLSGVSDKISLIKFISMKKLKNGQ